MDPILLALADFAPKQSSQEKKTLKKASLSGGIDYKKRFTERKESTLNQNEPNERRPLMNGNKAATQNEKGSGEKCEQETTKAKQKPSEATSEKNSGLRESEKERLKERAVEKDKLKQSNDNEKKKRKGRVAEEKVGSEETVSERGNSSAEGSFANGDSTSLKKMLGGNNATSKEKERKRKEEVAKLTNGDNSTFKKGRTVKQETTTESEETNEKIAKERHVQEKNTKTKSANGKMHKGKNAGNKTKDGWTVKDTSKISSRKSFDVKSSSGKKGISFFIAYLIYLERGAIVLKREETLIRLYVVLLFALEFRLLRLYPHTFQGVFHFYQLFACFPLYHFWLSIICRIRSKFCDL